MNLESIPLSNGVKMPRLGYGVYQVDPTTCEASVREALEVGYRAIDTAQAYHNEEGVGRAIKGSGLPREDIFLTTKVWVSKAGKVRAIGVSNFFPDRLVDLCQFVEIRPMVNQVETHALYQQKAAHAIMEKYGVVHESWGPFAVGRKDFFTNPVLAAVGAKHGKSVAQVALRFLLQSDVVVIPKSVHKARMAENLQVFDFSLDAEDMAAIQALDQEESAFFSHYDPATVEFITGLEL